MPDRFPPGFCGAKHLGFLVSERKRQSPEIRREYEKQAEAYQRPSYARIAELAAIGNRDLGGQVGRAGRHRRQSG